MFLKQKIDPPQKRRVCLCVLPPVTRNGTMGVPVYKTSISSTNTARERSTSVQRKRGTAADTAHTSHGRVRTVGTLLRGLRVYVCRAWQADSVRFGSVYRRRRAPMKSDTTRSTQQCTLLAERAVPSRTRDTVVCLSRSRVSLSPEPIDEPKRPKRPKRLQLSMFPAHWSVRYVCQRSDTRAQCAKKCARRRFWV